MSCSSLPWWCSLGAIVSFPAPGNRTPTTVPQTNLRDFLVWLTAFLCTIFLGVELGLGISIGLALLIVICETGFPHTAILGRVDNTNVYRNIEQYPGAKQVTGAHKR